MTAQVDLASTIDRAQAAMLDYVRRTVPNATIFSFGAIELDPKHLAIWIRTATDKQRDRVLRDPAGFEAQMRDTSG